MLVGQLSSYAAAGHHLHACAASCAEAVAELALNPSIISRSEAGLAAQGNTILAMDFMERGSLWDLLPRPNKAGQRPFQFQNRRGALQ